MTRNQIREKYGIVRLESSDIANRELSQKEAKSYDECIKMSRLAFDAYWDDDNSGDIE